MSNVTDPNKCQISNDLDHYQWRIMVYSLQLYSYIINKIKDHLYSIKNQYQQAKINKNIKNKSFQFQDMHAYVNIKFVLIMIAQYQNIYYYNKYRVAQIQMDNQDLYILKGNFVQFRNDNIIDSYQFYPKELGRGSYGVVYQARDKFIGGPWRAVKQIRKKLIKNPNSIKNEVNNLVQLDHPTILKIYEIFEDANSIYLVTEYQIILCQGGQLFQKLQKMGSFSQRDARQIFAQILQAINYCHKKKVAHRDLKPQNILFLNNHSTNLKLIDFGLSFKFQENMKNQLMQKHDTKIVGTAYYMAPQIINGQYDARCDIWSAGVILYIMVTAIPPFDGQNDKQIFQAVVKGQYSFDFPEMEKVSNQCKDLISKILVPDNKRLTIDQIFNHPWMKNDLPSIPLQLSYRKLNEYSQYFKLKKITANFIASKFSQKQVQGLSILFKQIDTNNDGQISIEELKVMQAALESQHQNKSYKELKEIMDAIDTDKNGSINYTEFVASSVQAEFIFTKENLYRVFRTIDKDGNGEVDINQLREILQKNNLSQVNGKQLEDVMRIFDTNKDGKIDFNEFIAAMTK